MVDTSHTNSVTHSPYKAKLSLAPAKLSTYFKDHTLERQKQISSNLRFTFKANDKTFFHHTEIGLNDSNITF